jgi:undecaprenyl-diphosphatase
METSLMNLQSLDAQLLLLINNGLANGLFDVLMPVLSRQGYLMVLPFLAGMIVWGSRTRKTDGRTYLATALWAIAIAFCAIYVTEWVEDALKVAVGRVRPCRALEGVKLIIACPKSFSFPSGHSITSFGVALPLFYLTRGYIPLLWRCYPLLLATAIAFSRLYLGVHYPTDVLGGALFGAAIGLGLAMVYRLVEKRIYREVAKDAKV